MPNMIERNKGFLADLFAGPFRGHGIIMTPPRPRPAVELGDFTLSERPVTEWLPWAVENYASQVRTLEMVGDDSVPYVSLNTNTGIFASAFGCPIHVYANDLDTNASARPIVRTAAEADRLPEPDLQGKTMTRIFEFAQAIRRELGPEVPIAVPDIQSPFDIAAIIWNKEEFFYALLDDPEAVRRLVQKCHRLLVDFLTTFQREVPGCSLCHCPIAWAPPELGMWLSEDEAGALSAEMFTEFCLPNLIDLSEQFGGLFMHSCATADHQYENFACIPNLRGLNRVYQTPGARPAIEAFSGKAVLIQGWLTEDEVYRFLEMARSDTRYLFNVVAASDDEAREVFARLRDRCPREEVVA